MSWSVLDQRSRFLRNRSHANESQIEDAGYKIHSKLVSRQTLIALCTDESSQRDSVDMARVLLLLGYSATIAIMLSQAACFFASVMIRLTRAVSEKAVISVSPVTQKERRSASIFAYRSRTQASKIPLPLLPMRIFITSLLQISLHIDECTYLICSHFDPDTALHGYFLFH